MNNNQINIPIILFSILPISIILGSGVSLINTVLISLCFIFVYFTKNKIEIYDYKPIIFLSILNLYLVFNSLISVDMMSGIYRNFGFVRFLFFFLMINYLFFISEKSLNILKIWTLVFFIVLIDIYIERFTGNNILGFSYSLIADDIQTRGYRVVSFLELNQSQGLFVVFLL